MKFVKIPLTQGNINNQHLYLSSVFEFFPLECIGGSNADLEGEVKLELHVGFDQPVFTDIAGDKKIFRKRSWVGEFFETHKLKAGDFVVIEHTGRYRYHVYPAR